MARGRQGNPVLSAQIRVDDDDDNEWGEEDGTLNYLIMYKQKNDIK